MARYTTEELFSMLEYSARALGASDEELYEFTRCVRPDGRAYGTRGKCKKGTEQAKGVSDKKPKTPRSGGESASPEMVKIRVGSTVSSIVKQIKKEGLWHRDITPSEEKGIAKEVVKALKDFDLKKEGVPSVPDLREAYWARQLDSEGGFRGSIPGVDTED